MNSCAPSPLNRQKKSIFTNEKKTCAYPSLRPRNSPESFCGSRAMYLPMLASVFFFSVPEWWMAAHNSLACWLVGVVWVRTVDGWAHVVEQMFVRNFQVASHVRPFGRRADFVRVMRLHSNETMERLTSTSLPQNVRLDRRIDSIPEWKRAFVAEKIVGQCQPSESARNQAVRINGKQSHGNILVK